MLVNKSFVTRRRFLRQASMLGLLAGIESLVPAYARGQWSLPQVMRNNPAGIDLSINKTAINIGGRDTTAIAINQTVPGPLLRLREGDTTTINVTNHLNEDTSIHWHGIILPANMDGVPGVSYPGIRPGETFTYHYEIKQNGTYWYHSHSGLQEQLGHYGPLIIDPAEPEPYRYDREYVVILADWTFEDPHKVLAKLKKQGGYYNFQKRTVQEFFADVGERGWGSTAANRLAWARMRMDPTDFADISGYTYTYLINGLPPVSNWTGLFRPGERVRLRFINAATMTYFDVRIPGLRMTVVQADGQNVQPVEVDEFRIAVAETYDVIVEPTEDRAYTVFAESLDRSGFARGTLSPREGMSAPIPKPRPRPIRTMADMGMGDMDGMPSMGGQSNHGQAGKKMPHDMSANDKVFRHGPDHHGPGNSMIATLSKSRMDEPSSGLEDAKHRVLVYRDLRSLKPGHDPRPPEREVELHLTGNMERYMWSFDGKKFSEVNGPVQFYYGERLRLVLVNDTMMDHPIHLHGMWMELENGHGDYRPFKHTISLKPAERVSALISADAPGHWAFHCHLLYHMEMGMFRVVTVSERVEETPL